MKSDVKDLELAKNGKRRIEWAESQMPVLNLIKERFKREKPFSGKKIGACLHVTCETANLMRALKAGGAEIVLCASNPLSTQDDVVASLAKDYGINTFAIKGEDKKTYYKHLNAVLDFKPAITLDDGADLISLLHSKRKNQIKDVLGSMEETTTGVIRLRAMEKDKALMIPIIAVNDALTKHLFDNRYGTGQSTIDGIIRATGVLFAGQTVVVVGYGWCGRGFASRCKGLGANVIVCEVDPIKAIEASMDGFMVMPMQKAASLGDVFCTLTGDINVINSNHFRKMKDNAIVCNSGHFNAEIDIDGLKKISKSVKSVNTFVEQYILENGNKINLLAEGRLINLSAAEGHPASVMDMSFANQALCVEYVVENYKYLSPKVYSVPKEIDEKVAKLKLDSMGIKIDKLSSEQKKYLNSWEMGT